MSYEYFSCIVPILISFTDPFDYSMINIGLCSLKQPIYSTVCAQYIFRHLSIVVGHVATFKVIVRYFRP